MRNQLCKYVPEITALAGLAENIPLVGGSVAVVVCPIYCIVCVTFREGLTWTAFLPSAPVHQRA